MRCCSLEVRRSCGLLVLSLTASLWAGSAAALPALFDFGAGPALSGWSAVDPANPTATSQGIQLVLSATAPAGYDDRDRGLNGNGGGAEADMWRDFIFAVPDPGNGDGLLITLSGLSPGASYDVSVWSFDSAGAQVDTRLSQWNGVVYTFTPKGGNPQTLADNLVTLLIQADANGMAQVLGDSLETTDPGAFINGLSVALVPEPATAILLGLGGLGLSRRKRP